MARDRKEAAQDQPGSDPSAPETLQRLVQEAERAGASDIHLQTLAGGLAVSYRLDGVMTSGQELSGELGERVLGRIKFLARLKTYQESLPQDGRINKEDVQARSDIRVATYPTVTGEKVVLRLFNTSVVRTLAELEFPAAAVAELERVLKQEAGLLLLTGPTGSGKTTTIYACLRELAARGSKHIITVEDPAEQILPGVMQTEVSEARGLDFAKAARHLLRQDPQILMIGEIRDEETANLAVRAGLTGHLVISTLHARSCHGVLERLLTICKDQAAVGSALELILNQRLVRRLCRECAGAGCLACLHTGYRGRLPIVEWLRIDDSLRQRIANHDLAGMSSHPSLKDSAEMLIAAGTTNNLEITRVLGV